MEFLVLETLTKPLASVSQMVSKGFRVVFDSDADGEGAFIEHKRSGDKHRLFPRGGVYCLPVWRRKCANKPSRSDATSALGAVATEKAKTKQGFQGQA